MLCQVSNMDIRKTLYQISFLLILLLVTGIFAWQQGGAAATDQAMEIQQITESECREKLAGMQEDMELLVKAALEYNGYALPYDSATQTFYLSQSLDQQDFTGKLSAAEGAQVIFPEDDYWGDKAASLRDNHHFQVLVLQDGRYAKAQLVVSGLPVISVTTASEYTPVYPIEDIDNYVYNSETRYQGDITIFQANAKGKILNTKLEYHERGATSANFSKKNYALKLLDNQGDKTAQSLFGMKASAKWKMIAMYTDVSKVRDKTALDLWNEMAEASAVSEQGTTMEYCELVLNGEYKGLYGIMLPVDEDTLGLGPKDVLYKVLDWYMPAEEEIQASVDQQYPVCYPIRVRYPKSGSVEKLWAPLRSYFRSKYWNMDLAAYEEMIYPENVADFYMFIQAVSGYDNYLKNTYLVASPAQNKSGFKFTTIPWDLNYTFGDCYVYDGDRNYTAFNGDVSVNYVEPVIQQYFTDNETAKELLQRKWSLYRQNILSTDHIQTLMQDNQQELLDTGAFARDTAKWPESGNNDDLTEIMDYIAQRMAYLDGYFGN